MRDAIERLASNSGQSLREQLRAASERNTEIYALAAHCRVPGIKPGRILPERIYRAVLAFVPPPPRRH